MGPGSGTWRRRLARLGGGIVIAWSLAALSCGGLFPSPSQPSQPSTPSQPATPACTVRLWACATNGYGAIAYSPSTHASGIAYNYSTRSAAESSAVSSCAKSDCAPVAWFQNSCGAIAVAPTGEMATGTGTTGDTAQAFAMATCLSR